MVDPFSIISTLDLCFKYGSILVELCSAFKNATSKIIEGVLRLKNYWIRAEVQLKVVESIAHTLDDEHQKIQQETLDLLASKLKIAVQSIESVIKSKDPDDELAIVRVKRWKYALVQQKIENAIQDLELWQQMFDPSWYLIIKAANPQIDTELKVYKQTIPAEGQTPLVLARSLRSALAPTPTHHQTPIFLPEKGLHALQLDSIPLCSAKFGQREGDISKALIVERIHRFPETDIRQLERDVRDLARKLAHSSPLEFGLLNCKGVIKYFEQDIYPVGPSAFTFVFRIPPGLSQPQSLRSVLQHMKQPDSLSDRFRLANELARAVSYVHTFGFVHKNIRPETVLLLRSEDASIGSTFLIGFDSFRSAEGKTIRKGDLAWERCLYQHPGRIGPTAREDYIMQHDIYSLGVCLLELGLWESFVLYGEGSEEDLGLSNEEVSTTRTTPAPVLGSDRSSSSSHLDRLLSLARGELRTIMGTRYSEVVVTCLTCLDPGNVDFGDESEFQDDDGIQVGVIMRLNGIFV
ncbi:hypothetical protein UA08_00880 [Talaromyces atroroseus]|uniref:Protein kinase domain-containing protein n=1 Tax=Talaromyces atroroseus TaxID=1441469 RepID=A0A225BEH7_TALAT|nr:hypothetical protein UA08_00880 [Talaromyces atroroseus]OKL64437.1 hypothetical protein UA08_00880 [Talaromyces atroroseus]